MEVKKIKISYLEALQDGDTVRAADMLQLLSKINDRIPDMTEPLPVFPENQCVILTIWVLNEATNKWLSNITGDGITRPELDAIITRDWKLAFHKETKVRRLHQLIHISQ